MSKRFFLFSVAIVLLLAATAQGQDLVDFNVDRLQLNKTGMYVLGGWAAANIISSPILASNATGSDRYFHQMNGYWNAVNLTLAGFGLYSATTADPASFSFSQTLTEQHSLEKILLFNAGLDLAYISGGLYMVERSKRNDSDRLKGFGQSIMLQGAFLFAFDIGFYLVQHGHGQELLKMVDQFAVSPAGFSLSWKI